MRVVVALAAATALIGAAPALGDVPAGQFVLGAGFEVEDVAVGGGGIFVAGRFLGAQAPTGSVVRASTVAPGTPVASGFPAVDGAVNAIASDGSGGWFVGGRFTRIGGVQQPYLAHVTPAGTVDTAWDPAVADADFVAVDEIVVAGSRVYVAGFFSTVDGLPRAGLAALDTATGAVDVSWNPTVDGNVDAIAADAQRVYLGGFFSTVGGQPRENLAAVDAATGAPVSGWTPSPNNPVSALTRDGARLYVGGSFSQIGGGGRNSAAALDAATGALTTWDAAISPHDSDAVQDVLVDGPLVYLVGFFSQVGGQSRDRIAAVAADGGALSSWNPGASLVFGEFDDIALAGERVIAGGTFVLNSTEPSRHAVSIVRTTGAIDAAWNPNPNGEVEAVGVAIDGQAVVLGGDFTGAGPFLAPSNHVVRLNEDGSLDTDWGARPNGGVEAVAISGSRVYLGGRFGAVDGTQRDGLAAVSAATGALDTAWDHGEFDDGHVSELLVHQGRLYAVEDYGSLRDDVVGAFQADTGAPSPGWTDVFAEIVNSLAAQAGRLYMAGSFSTINDVSRGNIAAVDSATGALITGWNPSTNTSFFNTVAGLAIGGGRVYIGGRFSSVGGVSRDGLAAVDAVSGAVVSDWDPSVEDDNAIVLSLRVAGERVYVGGLFSSLDGQPRSGLAALDATTGAVDGWNPGSDGTVRKLAPLQNGRLVAAGFFSRLDGQAAPGFGIVDGAGSPPDVTPPTVSPPPSGGEPIADEVVGSASGSGTLTQPQGDLPNPVSFVGFGSVAQVSASVSASGAVRLSRPLVFCPSGPPMCRVTAAATAQLPRSGSADVGAAARRAVRVGRSVALLLPGQAARIRFTLNRRGLDVLRRRKRLRVAVRIVATHRQQAVRTVRVTLNAPGRRR